MKIDVERLQAYLRWSAGRNRIAIDVAPFTLYVSPHDERPWFNYAVPNQPVDGDPRGAVSETRVQFARAGRRAAFEYLEAYAPNLAPTLAAAGFVVAERETVMWLEPEETFALRRMEAPYE